MDEEEALAKKKLRGLHHEGYNYSVKDAEKTKYGCIKKGCRAKLYIDANQDPNTIRLVEAHTCIKSSHQSLEKRVMRQILKDRSSNNLGSPKLIFDETSLQHKNIATHMAYPNVQKTIQRSKAQSSNPGLKKFSSIKAFGEFLIKFPNLLTYKLDNSLEMSISAHLISSSSGSDHLILYDESLVREFEDHNDIFVDGTFRIRPDVKGVQQVLTVMCKKNNIVVPCIWVLMSRRTTKAYNAVWKHVKEKFPAFSPSKAMCDFEKALIKSIRTSFTNVIVRGCYFHFCQAVIRQAKSKKHGIYLRKENKDKNPEGHNIIKKLLLIPLLPESKITEGVQIINKLISEMTNTIMARKWQKFMECYFEKQWMVSVTPEVFCVFNNVDRTNNYLESYHRTLNERIRTKPTTYTFLYNIIKIKEKSVLDLNRSKNKLKVTQVKRQNVLHDEFIRHAWQEMVSPAPWTVSKFLNELTSYHDNSLFDVLDAIVEDDDENESDCEEIVDSDVEDEYLDFKNFRYLTDAEEEKESSSEVTENLETVDHEALTSKDIQDKQVSLETEGNKSELDAIASEVISSHSTKNKARGKKRSVQEKGKGKSKKNNITEESQQMRRKDTIEKARLSKRKRKNKSCDDYYYF